MEFESLYRVSLKIKGANFPPKKPDAPWMNTTLKTKDEVFEAIRQVKNIGLFPNPFPAKNWDSLAILQTILDNTTPRSTILDAGSSLDSTPLHWLYLYGYRKLIGINLAFPKTITYGPIKYLKQDLTHTKFRKQSFDVVICQSVIEHGVSIHEYFEEMSRILKHGGTLITSTDYWENSVDTKGKMAFGTEIRIFDREDLSEMLCIAERNGFRKTGDIDLECNEKAVHWTGLNYTFIVFALKRR
jgi:SAM-dependent methyltransferase